jgi:hypothetical protein
VLMPHRHDSAKCVNAIISHEKASDNSNSGWDRGKYPYSPL